MFIPLHDQNSLKSIRLQFVTLGIIGINILAWLITATPQLGASQANSLYYSYGFVPAVVNDLATLPPDLVVLPQSASYVTYAFLHGDFMHLAGNMLFLWVFGDNVEDAMGHFRFLVFFLLCAAAGALAHSLVAPQSEIPLIGASGAAAGVIGGYLMLHPRVKVWILVLGRIPLRLSAVWVLGAWIAFQLYNIVFDTTNQVSWAAHIGGILAGMIFIVLFKRRNVLLFDAGLSQTIANTATTDDAPKTSRNPVKSQHKWGRD